MCILMLLQGFCVVSDQKFSLKSCFCFTSIMCFQIQVDAMIQLVSQPDELLGVKQPLWPQRNNV